MQETPSQKEVPSTIFLRCWDVDPKCNPKQKNRDNEDNVAGPHKGELTMKKG